MGDRSIVLLIGLALLIYGFWENSRLRKPFSYAALVVGIAFLLLSILVIRDGLTLQSQTVERIGQEATQLQTQVEQSRTNPEITATPDEFAQILQTIDAQAETLKQNAKTSLIKASLSSVSNLVVMGTGGASGSALGGSSKTRKQRLVSAELITLPHSLRPSQNR